MTEQQTVAGVTTGTSTSAQTGERQRTNSSSTRQTGERQPTDSYTATRENATAQPMEKQLPGSHPPLAGEIKQSYGQKENNYIEQSKGIPNEKFAGSFKPIEMDENELERRRQKEKLLFEIFELLKNFHSSYSGAPSAAPINQIKEKEGKTKEEKIENQAAATDPTDPKRQQPNTSQPVAETSVKMTPVNNTATASSSNDQFFNSYQTEVSKKNQSTQSAIA